MHKITIKTEGKEIRILGEAEIEEKEGKMFTSIGLHPEQIPLLIKWLKEAAKELEGT